MKNVFRKNWRRRFQEFLALAGYRDPDFPNPSIRYRLGFIKFAWYETVVNGYTKLAVTKSPYLCCDPETLVCDGYYNR